jgi:peptidyl-prolyl cis-trans isomerase D
VIKTNPIALGDSLPGIGAGPASSGLMNDIFQVKENSEAQATRTPQGVVVFKVDKVIPRSSPTFEAIKDKVTNDFKSERASVLVNQKTAELSDRARTEHDLRKAAKEAGATFKSSDLVGHTSQVPEIGSMSGGSASAIFKLKPGEISGPLNVGRNGVVVALTDRQEPSTTGDEFAKAKDGLYEQLVQERRQEAIELFVSNLQDRLEKEGKLKINKNELGNLTRGT